MKKVIKISSAICGALLAVLGFSKVAMSYAAPQYVAPIPREVISGKVTDKVTGKPIKGIKVTNQFENIDDGSYNVPSDFSDENGEYTIRSWGPIHPNLKFSDVDGKKNGLYNDTIVPVDVRNIALTPKK